MAQPLDSLVRHAWEVHPSVAAARIAIQQADARARSAAAWEPPAVGLEFSMLPPSNLNPFSAGETMLMVEQMIPLFGQNRAMAQAMEREKEVAEADVASVQRTLRARVEREYYTLWLLDRRSKLNVESRKLADLLYKTAEVRYTTNTTGQSDIYRITIETERLASEAREIERERIEALGRLNALLVRPQDTPVDIIDDLTITSLPSFDSLAVRIAGHPELREMEAMARMSRAEAEAQEAMLRPMLMLRAGVSYMPEGHPLREGSEMVAQLGEHGGGAEMDPMHFGLLAGAMLSVPIAPWSRSGPAGRAEAYRLEAEEQLLRRDAMRQDMLAMLRSAYGEAERARIRVDYYQRTQIPLLERSLEAMRADYTNRRTDFSSLVDMYSMLIMAHMESYMQQMEYAMAVSMIAEMTGEGSWKSDVGSQRLKDGS
jgi:outer membrane protein TolC